MLLSVPSKILRIILDRTQETVNKKLRKEQPGLGLRKDKSCTTHIATPRIIVEQMAEFPLHKL